MSERTQLNQSITEAFLTALKSMSQWTFPFSKFSSQPFAEREVRRAYRLGPVGDVFVERGDVEEGVRNLIGEIKSGQMLKLVAGTGTGKSTLVAVWLAKRSTSVVIAVTPRPLMAKTLASYVKANITVGARADCMVSYCVSASDVFKLSRPAVAYMGVSDFLCMCAMRVGVLSEIGVKYVYVDEAHEKIPQYEVISYLKSVGEFQDVVMLMGSATSSSQDMEFRTGGITRVHKEIQPELLTYDDVSSLSSRSPLHQSNISSRTLVYVPSSDYFPLLRKYYTDHALPVIELPEYVASSKFFGDITSDLAKDKRPSVILATQEHQTCYSMPIDTVVDCGVTLELTCDLTNHVYTVHDRIATVAERVQRCGRVGRFQSGSSFTVSAAAEYEVAGVQSGSEIYVALWCKAFNVQLEDIRMRPWFEYVQRLSMHAVKVTLYSNIHPVLLSSFLLDDGSAHSSLQGLMPINTQNKPVVSTIVSASLVERAESWPVRRLSVSGLPTWMVEYKSQYEVPVKWQAWCAAMYHALMGRDLAEYFECGGDSMLNSSIASLNLSFRPARYSLPKFRPCSVASVSSFDTINEWKSSVFKAFKPVEKNPFESKVDTAFNEPLSKSPMPKNRDAPRKSAGGGDVETVVEIDSPAVKAGVSRSKLKKCPPDCVECADASAVKGKEKKEKNRVTSVEKKSRDVVKTSKKPCRTGCADCAGEAGFPVNSLARVTSMAGGNMVRSTGGSGTAVGFTGTRFVSPAVGSLLTPVPVSVARGREMRYKLVWPLAHSLWEPYTVHRTNPKQSLKLYENLKYGRVLLSNVDTAVMQDYFFACITLWNSSVSDSMQSDSQPDTRIALLRSGFEIHSKYSSRFNRLESLFDVFAMYGFLLAYQPRLQSGPSVSLVGLEGSVASANYAYGWASPVYRRVMDRASLIVTSMFRDGVRVGSAFKHGMVVYTCLHVYSEGSETPREFSQSPVDTYCDPSRDLAVLCFGIQAAVGSPAVLRSPLLSELVVVVLPFEYSSVTVGVYRVLSVGPKCLYEGRVPDGASGAPVVALSDGAVVGIHCGEVPFADGSITGEFISISY